LLGLEVVRTGCELHARRTEGGNCPACRARPGAQGRQQAPGRARVQSGARRPHAPPRGRLGYEPLSRRAACAFLRAAVLRCSAFLELALSIARTSSRCSAAARSWSPSATAVCRRFVSVLTVER